MRIVRVFKFRYLIIFILLAALYVVYQFFTMEVDQRLIRKEKINSMASIYITEVDLGATTATSYRYYVAPNKGDEYFIQSLEEGLKPFLLTSDPATQITVIDGAVHLIVHGDIFQFRNSPAYVSNGATLSVPVYLDASPW
jgi:hypothetical protein